MSSSLIDTTRYRSPHLTKHIRRDSIDGKEATPPLDEKTNGECLNGSPKDNLKTFEEIRKFWFTKEGQMKATLKGFYIPRADPVLKLDNDEGMPSCDDEASSDDSSDSDNFEENRHHELISHPRLSAVCERNSPSQQPSHNHQANARIAPPSREHQESQQPTTNTTTSTPLMLTAQDSLGCCCTEYQQHDDSGCLIADFNLQTGEDFDDEDAVPDPVEVATSPTLPPARERDADAESWTRRPLSLASTCSATPPLYPVIGALQSGSGSALSLSLSLSTMHVIAEDVLLETDIDEELESSAATAHLSLELSSSNGRTVESGLGPDSESLLAPAACVSPPMLGAADLMSSDVIPSPYVHSPTAGNISIISTDDQPSPGTGSQAASALPTIISSVAVPGSAKQSRPARLRPGWEKTRFKTTEVPLSMRLQLCDSEQQAEGYASPDVQMARATDESASIDDSTLTVSKQLPIEIVEADAKKFYDMIKIIGKGRYGKVWLCKPKLCNGEMSTSTSSIDNSALLFIASTDSTNDSSNKPVSAALPVESGSNQLWLAAKFLSGVGRRKEIENEVEILKCVAGHKNVIQLVGAYYQRRETVILTEYIPGGELFRLIAENDVLTENIVLDYTRQILQGLEFVHSKNIIHRDLKPENILCVNPAPPPAGAAQSRQSMQSGVVLKLIDFGFATFLDSKKPNRLLGGTTLYMAPETINYDEQGFYTDVWAVGVIAYNMLSGFTPFEKPPRDHGEGAALSDQEIFVRIQRGEFDFDDAGFNDTSCDAKDFISSILKVKPSERLTASECLSHRWISQSLQRKNSRINRNISRRRVQYVYLTQQRKLSLSLDAES